MNEQGYKSLLEILCNEAADLTEKEFAEKVSSLTSLTDKEFIDLINESTISHEDLTKILGVIHDVTLSNEKKAQAIANISGGLSVLVNLTKKLL